MRRKHVDERSSAMVTHEVQGEAENQKVVLVRDTGKPACARVVLEWAERFSATQQHSEDAFTFVDGYARKEAILKHLAAGKVEGDLDGTRLRYDGALDAVSNQTGGNGIEISLVAEECKVHVCVRLWDDAALCGRTAGRRRARDGRGTGAGRARDGRRTGRGQDGVSNTVASEKEAARTPERRTHNSF